MIIAYNFNNYRFKHDWIDKEEKRALFLSFLKVHDANNNNNNNIANVIYFSSSTI